MLRISFVFFIGFCFYSCQRIERESKIEIPLNASWELRETGGNTWIPAHVPGSVASDLLECQKKGQTAIAQKQNLCKTNWEYRTAFDVGLNILGQDVVNLCFKGIEPDTYIYLNDSLLLTADNIFRSWVVNCKMLLKPKDNRLRIVLHHAKRMKWRQSMLHLNMACNPQNYMQVLSVNNEYPLCSPGIWDSIILQAWSIAKIEDLGLKADSITQQRADYSANYSILSVERQDVTLEFLVNNRAVLAPVNLTLEKGSNFYRSAFTIEKPRLWWTNGLGDPYLYNITVRLKKGPKVIHELHQRLGVRTIELISKLNSPVKGCFFKLNGVPLFIKGASYVNLYYAMRATMPDYYKNLIETAHLSNFNILRVSDKGIYGDDALYNLCDENGILVWQDFMVNLSRGCKDSAYAESFKQEAIEVIKRLRNHPCMALWWGNDQPRTSQTCCNLKNQISTISNYEPDHLSLYFQELLPSLVREYAYSVPYQHFKAFADTKSVSGIDLLNGQMIGSIAMEYGVPAYGFSKPGQGLLSNDFSGTQPILSKVFSLGPEGSGITEGDKIVAAYVQKNFGASKSMDTMAYYTWLAQSELLKTTIENHRINMPVCMGTMFQHINGGVGGLSFSTIDSSGNWKPSQYAIKDAYSHVLVVPVREKNVVKIYGVSDALKDLDAILLVRLINFKGQDLYVKQIPINIEANTSNILLSINESELLRNADKSKCCLVVQINQATKTLSQNMLYFTEFKNLSLTKPAIDLDINEAVKGYNIILKSTVLVKSIFIRTVSKTCWFSENNFDLLPGKRTKINVRYKGTKEELLKDIQIRSFTAIK